ncbi:serine/threonine-protein kinase [Nocardia altamirensis]|uniref:serine/threonine-protein kinase n=1 Tax=Nocardia altamirensis TaxID=472158 RepID=UPI0008403D37|nr:serine/threonine-protein kinase [Nocardia altamirensis]
MRPLGADDPSWIGDYRLLGLLGSGGMGRVYLGRNAGGRTVAVKVIRPDFLDDTEFRARFRREVSAAQRVGGQFTAPVLDADVDANPPWLATGYVAGFSLAEAVEEYGPFTENSLLVLAHGLAEALVAVHAAGLVHRDLKPSNVLLALDGPKVIDFGIARAVEDSRLTTTGKVIGSPGFMCPEQVTGNPVGPGADVFALGGVLCFAATGHGPFGVAEMVSMLWRVVYEEPDLDGVPAQLRPLVAACLNKDPAARPTPERLIADLTALGIPARGGWLPGPALEEVSRRAVALLDLDSGPIDRPASLTPGAPLHNPARTADTVARPPEPSTVLTPPSLPRPADPQHVQGDATPRSWWQGDPDPGQPPPRPVVPQAVSHQPTSTLPPTPPRRPRTLLIAGAVAVCVLVAISAFMITRLIAGNSDNSEKSATTPGESTSESAAQLPDAFVGEWRGVAKDALASFDIVLTLNAGSVGEEVGASTNTGKTMRRTCGRAETLTDASATTLTLTARLTQNAGGCNDEGQTTHLELQPDGTLTYTTPSIIGEMTGTLTRTS